MNSTTREPNKSGKSMAGLAVYLEERLTRDITEIKGSLDGLQTQLVELNRGFAVHREKVDRLEKDQERFSSRVWTAIFLLCSAILSFFFGLIRAK